MEVGGQLLLCAGGGALGDVCSGGKGTHHQERCATDWGDLHSESRWPFGLAGGGGEEEARTAGAGGFGAASKEGGAGGTSDTTADGTAGGINTATKVGRGDG